MMAPPRCWSPSAAWISGPFRAEAASAAPWANNGRGARAKSAPSKRHVHGSQQQRNHSAGSPAATLLAAAAENRQPEPEPGEKKHALLGKKRQTEVARGMMQRRRMPNPDYDKFQKRHGIGGNSEGKRATGSKAVPATPSASSGAATATIPMCTIICALNGATPHDIQGVSQRAASVSAARMKIIGRVILINLFRSIASLRSITSFRSIASLRSIAALRQTLRLQHSHPLLPRARGGGHRWGLNDLNGAQRLNVLNAFIFFLVTTPKKQHDRAGISDRRGA